MEAPMLASPGTKGKGVWLLGGDSAALDPAGHSSLAPGGDALGAPCSTAHAPPAQGGDLACGAPSWRGGLHLSSFTPLYTHPAGDEGHLAAATVLICWQVEGAVLPSLQQPMGDTQAGSVLVTKPSCTTDF